MVRYFFLSFGASPISGLGQGREAQPQHLVLLVNDPLDPIHRRDGLKRDFLVDVTTVFAGAFQVIAALLAKAGVSVIYYKPLGNKIIGWEAGKFPGTKAGLHVFAVPLCVLAVYRPRDLARCGSVFSLSLQRSLRMVHFSRKRSPEQKYIRTFCIILYTTVD